MNVLTGTHDHGLELLNALLCPLTRLSYSCVHAVIAGVIAVTYDKAPGGVLAECLHLSGKDLDAFIASQAGWTKEGDFVAIAAQNAGPAAARVACGVENIELHQLARILPTLNN